MLRARPPGDPTGTGFVIPQMPPPSFPIPEAPPIMPMLSFGTPGLGTPSSYAMVSPPLSVMNQNAGGTPTAGPSLAQLRQQQIAKKTGAASGTGAAGGSASAVAASGPLPTHNGPAPAGTRDTVLRWLPQVTEAARKYDVPPELVMAVMHNRSVQRRKRARVRRRRGIGLALRRRVACVITMRTPGDRSARAVSIAVMRPLPIVAPTMKP